MAILGYNTIGLSTNAWNGDMDLSKFPFSGVTGAYTGSISVYVGVIAGGSSNKMTVGIYNADTGAIVIQSAEKTGLTVGWQTATLPGLFTLTNGVNYWLVVHAPNGNTGVSDTGGANSESWKVTAYSSTMLSSMTVSGTTASSSGSIYLTYTDAWSMPGNIGNSLQVGDGMSVAGVAN
jgi:hypothetical protein